MLESGTELLLRYERQGRILAYREFFNMLEPAQAEEWREHKKQLVIDQMQERKYIPLSQIEISF